MGLNVPVHVLLHLVKIEQRRPVRMPLEIVADDVLNDHFAAIEVRESDGVSQRSVGVWREICWKKNLFESYHWFPSSNSSFAGVARLCACAAPFPLFSRNSSADRGFSTHRE